MTPQAGTPNTEPWKDDSFLRSMMKAGDSPADEIATSLMADANLIYPFMNRMKDMRNLAAAGTIRPDWLDSYFRDHHEKESEPEWVKVEYIRTAQELFNRNPIQIIISLLCASLPECYAVESEAKILDHTGFLRNKPGHRVRQTGRLLLATMDHGGLDRKPPDGDPRWLSGRMAALQVRLLHAIMRRRLAGDPLAPRPRTGRSLAPQYGDVTQWLHWFQPQSRGRGLAGPPTYLNQLQLSYTLLTFSYVTVRSLKELGIRWTDEQVNAYIHAWNFVGWLLGVDEDLMAWNYSDAEELFERSKSVLRARSSRRQAGRNLTGALVEMLEDQIPGEYADAIPAATMRRLLDDETADNLNLSKKDDWRILNGVLHVLNWASEKAGDFVRVDRALAGVVDLLKDERTAEFSLNLDVDPLISDVKRSDPEVHGGDDK